MLTLLCAVFSTAWGQTTGEILFGTPNTKINSASVTGTDSQSNSWTITTTGTSSFTQQPTYSQVGSSNNPAKSITFTTTLPSEQNITAFSAKFGGFSGTAGTITLKVGNTTVGTGNLNGTSDVTVESTIAAQGTVLTVTVTGIAKGVKCYYISYTYGNEQPTGDKYYVAGSWTDPTWEDGKIPMTKNSDGKYILSNQLLPKNALFKIIKVPSSGTNSVWCGGYADGDNYWVTVDNHTDIPLNVGGGKDFYMPIAGIWTFIVDPTGDTPKLTVDGTWPKWEYYLVGDFNEWATTSIDSYKFGQEGETSNFTLNKPIKYGEKFKIYGIRGEEEKWFGAVSDGDFWVNAEQVGTELSLTTENGGENFYMNLSNKKDYWTLDFNPVDKTLKLSNYVSDVAELPFEFDGGRSAIEGKPGLTTNGLGTDYDSSPKLKFTTANNMVVLHFDERPGILSYDIKGNGFEGTFEVQTSENGENYTVLKTYTSISAATTGQHEVFDNLGENVRYIKWLYKIKDNGNVALGNIKLEKYVAPQPYTVTITQVENAEIKVFYNNSEIESGAEVLSSSEVKVSATASEDYQIESITVTDGDGQAVATTKVEGQNDTWTFTMPKSNVTVTCTVNKIPDEKWVLTDLADLTEDDIFVIVGKKGDESYAMSNNNGTTSGPTPISVAVVQDRIVSEVDDIIKWNISGNATDGYTFYPNGDNENWLYTKATNNGVRVGGANADGSDNKVFKLNNNYLYNIGTERYIGINGDWRCYTSINNSIAGQTFGFYKLVKKFTFTINEAAFDGDSYYATISDLGAGYYKVGDGFEVSTVAVDEDGKLEIAPFESGDIIPGKAAYLVKSATPGKHKLSPVYPLPSNFTPIDVNGNNMLYSTGSGKNSPSLPAAEMAAKPLNGGNYMFYKLSLNKSGQKLGFYWGAEGGVAFDYNTGHQAFLAVPQTGDSGDGAAAYLFDGDKTGIYNVMSTESESNNATYTLSGIRVDNKQLPKGIYIKNGKKVVVR